MKSYPRMHVLDLLIRYFVAEERARLVAGPSPTASARTEMKSGLGLLIPHLHGKQRVGFFPFRKDNRVMWGVIDIDSGDASELAAVVSAMEQTRLPFLIEKSKGKGWHLWLFFQCVPSAMVRRLLTAIVEKAGVECEVFPKQDRPGKTGNGVWLPLFGYWAAKTIDECRFVQTDGVELDQAAALESVRTIGEDELDDAISQLPSTPTLEPTSDIPSTDEVLQRFAGNLEEDRNIAAFTVAKRLSYTGLESDEALILLRHWNQTNKPPLPQDELEKTFNSAYKQHSPDQLVAPLQGGQQQTGSQRPKTIRQLRQSYTQPEWRIDKVLPQNGSLLIGGEPGAGKTWLALDAAVGVALGENWLGRFRCKQRKVLEILEEEDESSVTERHDILMTMRGYSGIRLDALPIRVWSRQGIQILDNNGELSQRLADEVQEYQPGLIVLDPLRRFHRQDENDSKGMSELFGKLQELTAIPREGCSLLIVHHLRKRSERDAGTDRLRGSTGIAASVDSIVEISGRISTGLHLQQPKSKRGPEIRPLKLVVNFDESPPVLQCTDEEDEARAKETEVVDFIVGELKVKSSLSQNQLTEIGKDNEFGRSRIQATLRRLKQEGRVVENKGPKNSRQFSLSKDEAE